MRFNTFEDYCAHKGISPEDVLPDVSKVPAIHQAAVLSATKLFLLADEINEGHEFDWNNWKERKWSPWFDMEVDEENPTGFRFLDSDFVGVGTDTAGGSRLCFRSEADSDYAGKTWEPYYRDVMVKPKK